MLATSALSSFWWSSVGHLGYGMTVSDSSLHDGSGSYTLHDVYMVQ